ELGDDFGAAESADTIALDLQLAKPLHLCCIQDFSDLFVDLLGHLFTFLPQFGNLLIPLLLAHVAERAEIEALELGLHILHLLCPQIVQFRFLIVRNLNLLLHLGHHEQHACGHPHSAESAEPSARLGKGCGCRECQKKSAETNVSQHSLYLSELNCS